MRRTNLLLLHGLALTAALFLPQRAHAQQADTMGARYTLVIEQLSGFRASAWQCVRLRGAHLRHLLAEERDGRSFLGFDGQTFSKVTGRLQVRDLRPNSSMLK